MREKVNEVLKNLVNEAKVFVVALNELKKENSKLMSIQPDDITEEFLDKHGRDIFKLSSVNNDTQTIFKKVKAFYLAYKELEDIDTTIFEEVNGLADYINNADVFETDHYVVGDGLNLYDKINYDKRESVFLDNFLRFKPLYDA